MATRQKTVVFAFPMQTSDITDASVTNLTQITVYLPESSPTFVSAFVEVGFQDGVTATGGTITEHRCGLRLGAAGYTTVTETDDLTNSGENMGGVIGPFDFTSHFTTNWTGTSMTCDCQLYFDRSTGTTLVQRNCTAILHVTYTYDDTEATQIKTVRIPMDSPTAGISTTANATFDTLPQLTSGGILPEASPTIRDWFIVIEGNEVTTAATDFTLTANIDSGTSSAFGTQEAALASDRFCRWVYKPSGGTPDPTTSHTFQLWSSLATRCNHITATLYVTYEFTLSGTTRTLNSIIFPMEIDSPMGQNNVAGDASRFERKFSISDPGTITMRQSAARLNWNAVATAGTVRVRVGGQSYRAYTTAGGVVCGMFSLQQRFDSGGAEGSGITLARGKNTFVLDAYSSQATNEATNLGGYFILNYESDIAVEGIGANAHTTMIVCLPWNALLTDLEKISSWSFPIPETDYRLMSVGFYFLQWTAASTAAIMFNAELTTGEGKEAGYESIYADAFTCDAERSCSIVWMRGRDVFKRAPTDPDTERMDIETNRQYRLYTTTTCSNGIVATATYHAISYTSTLTVTDSAGGTVNIDIFDASTHELVLRTSRVGNGTVDVTWSNDAIDVYAVAYESDTLLARSANFNFGD